MKAVYCPYCGGRTKRNGRTCSREERARSPGAVLRNHRGLTSVKRVKAVFRWCCARSGDARAAREKLATMPADADIDFLFSVYSASPSREDGGPEWGGGAVWEELHHRDPYPFWLD